MHLELVVGVDGTDSFGRRMRMMKNRLKSRGKNGNKNKSENQWLFLVHCQLKGIYKLL